MYAGGEYTPEEVYTTLDSYFTMTDFTLVSDFDPRSVLSGICYEGDK
jgi:hypothetical protein